MLQIDMRSERGILFVRLSGSLTKVSQDKLYTELTTFVKNMGIKNIVINLESLSLLDEDGEKALINCFKTCDENSYICIGDNGDIIRNKHKFNIVKYELEAFDLINS